MSSMISLKVKHADSIRKVFLPPTPPPVWPRLASALRDRFHVPPNQMIGLRYLDPESDLITISSQGELDDLWDEIRAGAKLKLKAGVSRKVVRLDLVIINSFPETALEIASPSTRPPPASDVILQDEEPIPKTPASQSVFPFDVPYSMLSSLELSSLLAMVRNVFDLPNSVHLALHHESEGKLKEIVSQRDLQTLLLVVDRSIPVENSGEGAGQAIRLIVAELSPTPTYPQTDAEDADGFVNVSSPSTITFDGGSNVPQTAVKMPCATNLEVPTEARGSPDVCPLIQASSSHASSPSVHLYGHAPLDSGLQECRSPDTGRTEPPLQPESAPDPPEEVAEDASDPDIEPLPTGNTAMHDISAPLSQLLNMAFSQPIGIDLARTIGTYANLIADATGQLSHVCRTLAEHVSSSQSSEPPFSSSTHTAPNPSPPAASHQPVPEIFTPKCNPQARYGCRASSETLATQVSPVANEINDFKAFPSPPKTLQPQAGKSQSLDVPVSSFFNILEGAEAHVSGPFMNPASTATSHQARIQHPAATQRSPSSMPRQTAPLRNLAAMPHQMDSTTPVNVSPPPGATPQDTASQPSFSHERGYSSSHDPTFTDPSHLPSLPWYPYLGFEGRAPTPFHVRHLPHHNHFIPRPPMIPSPYTWASTSDYANRSFPGTPFWHPHHALKAGHDPRADNAKPSKLFPEFTDTDFPENLQSSARRCNFSNYPATRQHFSLENMVRDIHFEPPTGTYKTSSHTLPHNSCLNTKSKPGFRDVSGRATPWENFNPKVPFESPDLSSRASNHHLANSSTESPHPAVKNEPIHSKNFVDILQMSKKSWQERESPRVSKFNVRPNSPDAQDMYVLPPEAPLASLVDSPAIIKSEAGEISRKSYERKANLMKKAYLVTPNPGELWDSDEPPSVDDVVKRVASLNGLMSSNSTSAIESQLARNKKAMADYNDGFTVQPEKTFNDWSCDERSFEKAKVGRGWVPYDGPSFQGAQDQRDVEVASLSEPPNLSGLGLGDLLKLSGGEDTSVRPWGYSDRDARGSDGWPIDADSGRDLFGPTGGKKSKKRNKKKNDRGSLLD